MTMIHLLGSEGFIGKAIQRVASGSNLRPWSHSNQCSDYHFDLYNRSTWNSLITQNPKNIIFLSWPGLPNYNENFHLTKNLPACIELVEILIANGLKKIVVAGTCYEYGMQYGELKESQLTDPLNCYSMAKDILRRFIEKRCNQKSIDWCWLRVFYPYGEGQNSNSLLPSLNQAIAEEKPIFEMSSGRQIRDFLPVELVAKHALALSTNPLSHGVYNSCSGKPRSIREIVEGRIKEKNSNIKPKFGVYSDRVDEPLAFWGCPMRINNLMKNYNQRNGSEYIS